MARLQRTSYRSATFDENHNNNNNNKKSERDALLSEAYSSHYGSSEDVGFLRKKNENNNNRVMAKDEDETPHIQPYPVKSVTNIIIVAFSTFLSLASILKVFKEGA